MNSLLEPEVVTLSFPLYKQRHFLMNHLFPILGGVLIGAISEMLSVGILDKLVGLFIH
ncbi:LrgB family protein [Viridibacillus arvi]|uniref:LrgB family protein n=1 Tax=Viridibacillus arvi TaxID=263475 RepID=UPI00368A4ECB